MSELSEPGSTIDFDVSTGLAVCAVAIPRLKTIV